MSSDIGELLREGIERATASEQFHPGLATRARQRHHRRVLTVRAAAVTGTAAMAAVAVLAATTGGALPQPPGGVTAQTTAYVVNHTERALAAAGRGGLVERVATGPSRTIPWVEADALVPGPPSKLHHDRRTLVPRRLDSLKIVRTTTWYYRGRVRVRGFAHGGQAALDIGPSNLARSRDPQQPSQPIAVDPHARQWFHPLRTLPSAPIEPLTCKQGTDWLGGTAADPAQYVALIRKALACGLFRADGQQQVNGTDALRLVATPRLIRQLHGEAGDIGRGVTLWVSAKTFLPTRLALGPGEGTTDFGWLRPTPANLALLTVKIPAGFHEVRLPAGTTLIWAAGPHAHP